MLVCSAALMEAVFWRTWFAAVWSPRPEARMNAMYAGSDGSVLAASGTWSPLARA
jgi:hypothetical protein